MANFEDYSFREYRFIHPLEKMPFAPKECQCDMKDKIFWISDKEFVMEREGFVSKAPYSDTFT